MWNYTSKDYFYYRNCHIIVYNGSMISGRSFLGLLEPTEHGLGEVLVAR